MMLVGVALQAMDGGGVDRGVDNRCCDEASDDDANSLCWGGDMGCCIMPDADAAA